jgi:hypothetical protein
VRSDAAGEQVVEFLRAGRFRAPPER